jgi:Mrp family chromosome partitioning ATPase
LESRPVNGRNAGAAVVAVTAAEAGEHKSAIGVSLARAATLLGKKTLLIDCDPAQSATAGMRVEARSGLYDVLTGTVPLARALVRDPRTSAHILTMKKLPPSLSTMFVSGQMAKLLEVLRGSCDLVVIDCARVGAGPEAALLARLADATVLVSRQAALYGPSLARSVAILQGAQAAPVGIVLTK